MHFNYYLIITSILKECNVRYALSVTKDGCGFILIGNNLKSFLNETILLRTVDDKKKYHKFLDGENEIIDILD